VEDAKGECNLGQHEINFRFDRALTTADGHAIYKNGAKENLSLRADEGAPVFANGHCFSDTFNRFLAGQLACLRELTLFFAPNINSYKRYAQGSFAPTAVARGKDNRTCSLRVVGNGNSLRVENRLPGGDVNPYLAISAVIAAGLHGIENELPLEEEFIGNAYEADKPHVLTNLREARELFAASEAAKNAFGGEVVEHYPNMARVEIEALEAAVTDWERYRNFERL
jgi:glutamine synthetase